jgi:glucosamine 6-phosphate synthetase-like amidotransferase/phosphosugar isomerase protein
MLEDIRRQPACLARLLGQGAELRATGRAALTPDAGGAVHAVGCGDGWFAARAVSDGARRGLGLPHRASSALEFLVYAAPHLTPADRVIAVSMSGNVDRTVEAWRAALARGAHGLVLTNGAGGRLAEGAPVTVSLDIPDLAPFLCGTSTYTGTVLALLLLLDVPGAERPVPDATIADALAWLPGAIADAEGWAEEIAARVGPRAVTGVRILAAGLHVATADYGAAKLVELTRIPAWSDDMEEFAHRQFWSADPRDLVVYLVPNARLARQANEGAEALAELGFETLAIESAGQGVPSARHRLSLPAVPEWLAPLVLPIPLQLLAYHLALATGLDPNTRAHLREDRARFQVSRKLTRRTLVGSGR